jgi:hypothetical protein
MTSRPELALDPWRTFLQSGGYRSRPVDGSGCVSFDDAWSIALPATPFEIETGAAPGSSVSMSLADATVELHESSPGLFTGQFDELDVPRSGALIRFEVSEAGTAQTFEGAALTYRAYVPRLANGWRPADR